MSTFKLILIFFTTLKYLLSFFIAIILQLVAMIFSPVIALFVDKETGNLPKYLRWFQTPDATCFDKMWVEEHPTWSKYKIARTWIARNPAYGFRRWCGLDPREFIPGWTTCYGNINIADGEHGVAGCFFIVDDRGYWNFSYVIDLKNNRCLRGELGWYLVPLIKGYESVNTGMLQSDPIRLYAFGVKGN